MDEKYVLVLLSIAYIICILLSRLKFGNFKNPITLIALFYLGFCLISCTDVCGYVVKFSGGRSYVLTNILILLCTSLFLVNRKNKEYNTVTFDNQACYKNLHNKLTVVVFLVELYFLISVLNRIFTGSISLLSWRNASYSSDSTSIFSPVEATIYFVFIKGYVIFDIIYFIVKWILDKLPDNKLPLINVCLFCLITINRIDMFRGIILFIILITVSNIKLNIDTKMKRRLILFLSILILLPLFVRFISTSTLDSSSLTETILTNFSAPYVMFDNFYNDYMLGDHIVECTIFDILFGGVGQIIEFILSPFGVEIINYNGILAEKLDYGIDIGDKISLNFNAFSTMYYNLVIGGGLYIPYFISILFGILFIYCYNKWNKRNEVRYLCLTIFLIHVILMGILRWEFYAHWSWFVIILFYIFFHKSNKPQNIFIQ